MKRIRTICRMQLLAFLLFVFLPIVACAQSYDVETTGEYVMGDSDTKIEARRLALEHAKRLASERIGTYLESETVVRDNQLAKDEIRSYTSAILKTTVLSEGVNLLSDKTTVFTIKIKANVDTSVLERKVKEIKGDTKRKEQLERLQAENINLLKELETVSAQLRSGKTAEYKKLREQRENLFERLDKNQNSISMTFEKGTLLNLAIKSDSEFEELKTKIDHFFKYYADNIKYKLGEPQVINHGEKSELLIPVTYWLENCSRLYELARSFCYYENKFEILGEPSILFFNNYAFKSAKPNELKKYMSRHYAKLKISVGKYRVIHDLFRNDSLALILKSHNTEEKIWISTSELSTIGSIDAEFIYGQFKSTDSTPDRPPIKRKQRKK